MRNGPLPQPGTYLGDDPDLTAELGQRLASTAQTTQGLITNYLFYGQRRAADGTRSQGGDRAPEVGLERSMSQARHDASGLLSTTVRGARRELELPPTDECEPGDSVVTTQQAEATRLTFRVVSPAETAVTDKLAQMVQPLAGAQQKEVDDPLAVDGLADNPGQHDPLSSPAAVSGSGRVTLDAEGPTHGR